MLVGLPALRSEVELAEQGAPHLPCRLGPMPGKESHQCHNPFNGVRESVKVIAYTLCYRPAWLRLVLPGAELPPCCCTPTCVFAGCHRAQCPHCQRWHLHRCQRRPLCFCLLLQPYTAGGHACINAHNGVWFLRGDQSSSRPCEIWFIKHCNALRREWK